MRYVGSRLLSLTLVLSVAAGQALTPCLLDMSRAECGTASECDLSPNDMSGKTHPSVIPSTVVRDLFTTRNDGRCSFDGRPSSDGIIDVPFGAQTVEQQRSRLRSPAFAAISALGMDRNLPLLV
jgi:hypothetical protein